MKEFTIEFKDKVNPITAKADRAREVDGVLTLYDVRMVLGLRAVALEMLDVVGRFTDYKCFYVKGGSDK